MSRFRAVTFDVTGTLLQFRLPPGEYYAKVGALFGVHIDPKEASKHFVVEWKRMNVEHPNFGLHSGIGWEKWWFRIVQQTFVKSSNVTHSEQTLASIYYHLMSTYQTADCWKPHVGVYEVLEHLSAFKIPLGIISNNDKRLDTILDAMDMRKYFDFVLSSYDAGFVKPDPQIFQKAFGLFNIKDLRAEQVIHVGDKVELDYLAAEKVGWTGSLVHVKDKKVMLQQFPQLNEERLFPALEDVAQYVTGKH